MQMISIITPSYNQGCFLPFCLASVNRQREHIKLEHLVFDGGSDDGSSNILSSCTPPLEFWQSCKDGGQSCAINSGLSKAQGHIMTWINSDDGLADGAGLSMTKALNGRKDPAWAIGGCEIVDEKNHSLGHWFPQRGIHDQIEKVIRWQDNYIMQPGVFWNRAMWETAGPLLEDLHLAMDFDLWLRFFKIASPILLTVPIGIHRKHTDTKTSNCGSKILDEYRRAIDIRLSESRSRKRTALRYLASLISLQANSEATFGNKVKGRALVRRALLTSSSVVLDQNFLKACVKLAFGK